MIICPNFSDKNVLKEFNELKELVGEIGAYHIWNENNGNPIDLTKDGKPSKLFSDLLLYYNGDRAAAIKGKAKTFTETFKMWFGDWLHDPNNSSKIVDENGEPKLVYHYTNNPELSEFSANFDNYFSKVKGGTKNAFFFTEKQSDGLLGRTIGIPVFLNVRNLEKHSGTKLQLRDSGEGFVPIVNRVSELDNSGVVFTNFDDNLKVNQTVYVATRPNLIKSIDNSGSFSTSDNRIKGSELDESLLYYLANSLDERYQQDVQEYIEAYRLYFDKYDYATKENLEKELEKVIQKIHDGLKARLYTLNKKDTNVTDEFKAALTLQISELENRTVDRILNITNFIYSTKYDILSTIRQIRDVVNGVLDKMTLKLLLDLKQDFFNFYCPMLDECVNTLSATEEYKYIVGENLYRNLLKEAKRMQTILNVGANNVNNMITKLSAEEIRRIGISVNSPTIENYILEHQETVGKDILAITAWVGAGDKINDEAIRALFHITQNAEFEVNRATYEKYNKLTELLKKAGTFNQKKLVELDENGLPTGYLVRKRNYGRFNNDYKQFLKLLRSDLGMLDVDDLRSVNPTIRTEYNKRKNKWLSEHCERKYTPEYYELFNNLSPLAADARELVQIKIHKLLDTVKDANGFYDTSKLSEENQSKLKDLYLEKKLLASIYGIDGKLKQGEEYEIAVELAALNDKLSKGMVLKSNKALFDKIKAEKKANLSEAQYQRWLLYNSRDEYTLEFYDDLSKVERSEINNESDKKLYELLQERKRAILKQFRDDKTHEIEKLIPGVAQAELDKIDVDLYKIRKRNGKKKTTGLKFNDIAKVIPSKLFYKLRADAIANGTLAEFEMTHCNRDSQGNIYPKSYLTTVVPVKEKYILKELPSIYFSEVDLNSPFVNKNYKPEVEDQGEYYLPKLELYDNSEAFNKVSLNEDLHELYKECVNTLKESNSKLTNLTNLSSYRLPQISGSMWRYVRARGFEGFKEYWKDKVSTRNDDTGLNDEVVDTGTDKLYFVPQNYVKSLDDPSTITANTVGSIVEYFKMAENFRIKSELKPKTEAILQFIGNRDVKSKYRGRSKKGQESNIYKFAKSFVEMNIYDIKTKSAIWDIKERDYSILGFKGHIKPRKVNFTKLMLGLKALGTTVNLGLNIICATTGFFTAVYNDIINSLSGRYYSFSDSLNGTKALIVDLFKNNFSLLSDYHNSTLMKLMEYFQVGAEIKTDRLNLSTFQKQIARNWAFGVYSLSDYVVKGHILNSVMYNYRYVNGEFLSREEFKRKYSNDEVMLNQWNTFRSSRDLVEYKNGDIVTKDPAHQKAWDAKKETIGNTARNLAQSADGLLTPLLKTMLSSNIIGSLVMMHRQFMPIILQERWVLNRQWDYSSQRYKEALFRVPFSIISAIRRDTRNISLWLKYMLNSTYDLRRVIRQLSLELIGVHILHFFLMPIAKAWADDDKDNILKQLLAFALVRTDFETMMSSTPWAIQDAISTIKTPFPIYSYYDNFSGLISTVPAWVHNLINNEDEKIDRGAYKGFSPTFKFGMKITPFKNIWELLDIPSKRRYYETQIANRDSD